jgi:prolyl-tRNA editing enzyme YbaK/EbsC (Cys-tRNA(Pro) deacylase)
MATLKPAAQRVQAEADALGLDIVVRELAKSTRTAEEAAAACGCAVAQIVKSLVFQGSETGTPYLLLVSGANRVDEKAVARGVGEKLLRPDAQFVRDVTGFAIGGIPPFGHAERLATFIDQDLLAHAVVWAAAGTPNALFSVGPDALAEACDAAVISMA